MIIEEAKWIIFKVGFECKTILLLKLFIITAAFHKLFVIVHYFGTF